MKTTKPTLLIPVELQVRELEAKLLLACVAANRGFTSVIGPRREMHFHIPSFTNSIYLSKSTTKASDNVFRYLERKGNKIVVWDEEALVSLPAEYYYRHRLSPVAIGYVSHLFAWGEANEKLWRRYPDLPANLPIHITGHPRGDLLRPELRGYYANDVKELREKFGNFILINSNFNLVNAYHQDMSLLMPGPNPDEGPVLTRRAKSFGLTREYAEGFTVYKRGILEDFKKLIPALDRAFPDYTLVVRPHPAENQEIYNEIAARCEHVRVINKGNVVPWLLAARVLIHNGCTTGVEAYALDVPAVAYRARTNDQYDRDFHDLPNQLSYECFNLEELQDRLKKILAEESGRANSSRRKALIQRHLAAMEGPTACERIVDVLDKITIEIHQMQQPTAVDHLTSWIWANKRRLKKRFKGYRKNMSHNKADFLKHRYPGVSLDEMQNRVSKFQQLLGQDENLKVEPFANQFFRIGNGG
jgi:surface carbohydrate biosynthesis protein